MHIIIQHYIGDSRSIAEFSKPNRNNITGKIMPIQAIYLLYTIFLLRLNRRSEAMGTEYF